MADKDNGGRNAELKIILHADSGYQATETHRITADQWGRIVAIANEAGEVVKTARERSSIPGPPIISA